MIIQIVPDVKNVFEYSNMHTLIKMIYEIIFF